MLTPFTSEENSIDRKDGMIASWVTDLPGGFSEAHLAGIKRLNHRLALGVKLAQREQMAENIVSAYLGADAGMRVLDGKIRLGDWEMIEAVIWYSDMRNSKARDIVLQQY